MSLRWKPALSSRAAGGIVAMCVAAAMLAPAACPLAAVEVRGNRELSDEQIRAIAAAGPEDDLPALVKRLQSAYIERGRLLTEIDVRASGTDSSAVIVIHESDPARYGELRVTGARLIDEQSVRAALGVERGGSFTPGGLRAGVRRVLDLYDGGGYPFAQVWVDSVGLDEGDNSIDFSIVVVEGGREKISRVEFEGLEHTKPALAGKLSGLKAGEPYSSERIRDAHLRLSASGAFEDVSYPSIRLAPDGTGVEALIRVVEPKGRNSFTGALGYADREGQQDRVLSGLVRLDLTNIAGSLKDLHVLWKNDGQGRSETRLAFSDRFFLGRRFGLGVTLEQVGQDTLYTWQSAGLEGSTPVGRLWGGLVGLEAGVYGDRNTFGQGDASSSLRLRLAAGVSFVEGREDRGAFIEFRTRHTYGEKSIQPREGGAKEDVSQYIFESRLRSAVDLFGNSHGAIEIVYRGMETDENVVPLSEQFYIGGASTVRGYRENQYHGRRTAYARSEYRIGKNRRENGYVFVDGGYVLQESLLPEDAVARNEELLVGYGFGLRTESRAGNIDISFGVGDDPSLRATKVHVILNRTF